MMTSKLKKKELNKTMLRSCGCSFSWGYERQGNIAFAYAMIPVLRKLFPQKEEASKALKRHLEYYNVTNQCMTFNLGIASAMEEEIAKNKEFDTKVVNETKVALMGPISGVGDAFFWGTFKIIATAVGTTFALQGNILGPILFFLIYNIPAFAIRIGLMNVGYSLGTKFLTEMQSNGLMSVLLKGATVLGLFVVGGMCASLVNLNIVYTFSDGANSQTVSDLLNQIMPCLASLLVFATTYWGIVIKKIKPITMIVLMTIIGIGGAYLGILG